MAASDTEVRVAIIESIAAGFAAAFQRIMRESAEAVARELTRDRQTWVEDHALLDDEDAARLLGVPQSKLVDLRDIDGLPHLYVGRRIRYDRHALLEWISKRIIAGEARP